MEFGEFIKTPTVKNVCIKRPFTKAVTVSFCITGHHVIQSSRSENHEELWVSLCGTTFDKHWHISVPWRLFGSASSVHKENGRETCSMLNECKAYTHKHSSQNTLFIDDISLKYPFFYRAGFEPLEDGWQTFLPENEYTRFTDCSEEWRLSYVNKDYKVCASYPHAVIVPKSIDDETVIKASQFRQNGRFPVLSYYHRQTKAVMMRCSQPLTGMNNKRCKEDERMVNSVMGRGNKGYIIDTRSPSAAESAQNKGGGYEPEVYYPQWRRIHQSVDRRQAFHDSLIKLMESSLDNTSSMDKWLSKLESSNWLSHVKDILTCACTVAQCIDSEGASVLVHGSEGFDTTLQVISLVQLILDHDCRTINGFEALVEREWLQGGHPFADRCSKSAFAITKQRSESPIFLLFLDCVWQIWQQFPCSFEFNEEFLILLFEHTYSSQFGTFLCNNEKERKECKLSSRTVSLWTYLARPEVLQKYLNPMYDPNPRVIWPSVAPQSLVLWSGLYQRSIIDQSKQKEAWQEVSKIREYDKELRSKVTKLRRQLASLEREALGVGLILPSELGVDCIPE